MVLWNEVLYSVRNVSWEARVCGGRRQRAARRGCTHRVVPCIRVSLWEGPIPQSNCRLLSRTFWRQRVRTWHFKQAPQVLVHFVKHWRDQEGSPFFSQLVSGHAVPSRVLGGVQSAPDSTFLKLRAAGALQSTPSQTPSPQIRTSLVKAHGFDWADLPTYWYRNRSPRASPHCHSSFWRWGPAVTMEVSSVARSPSRSVRSDTAWRQSLLVCGFSHPGQPPRSATVPKC